MTGHINDSALIRKLFFKLLPIQILLIAIGSINGIVSGLFATNMVGSEAMSAVGLFNPINMFIGAVCGLLVGGSQVVCGKFMGKNQVSKTNGYFNLSIVLGILLGGVLTVAVVLMGVFGLTGFFTKDQVVADHLKSYMIGQGVGVIPLYLGQLMAAFLSLERQSKRTIIAAVSFIVANVILNFVFVYWLKLEALGLALASSLGMWVFFLVQVPYYFTGKSAMKLSFKNIEWRGTREIFKIGVPAAAANGYMAARGAIVNKLVEVYIGSAGLSAFTAANTMLALFWAVPTGVIAVARMLMSISQGEEDRKTLKDVMKIGLIRCMIGQIIITAVLILLAPIFTKMYYQDPATDVYQMTMAGFRLLPICMPLALISQMFVCNGQVFERQTFLHFMSIFDGVIFVAGFSALLAPSLGMDGVYYANILNGIGLLFIIFIFSIVHMKRFPRRLDDLMMIPDDFGVTDDQRIDISIRSIEDVVNISQTIQNFCLERGIDAKRSYLAALSMEEMAGNVVEHGFTKDKKHHSVDVRVIHKGDNVILRLKDDCVKFNPEEKQKIFDPELKWKNIGIRTIYGLAKDIKYQNMMGLNVLTIKL